MAVRYEFYVVVDAGEPDKRQQLTRQIDIGLLAMGARITGGQYAVDIRRLSAKEVLKQAEDEKRCHADDDDHCEWPTCPQLRDGEPKATGRTCPRWAAARSAGEESE